MPMRLPKPPTGVYQPTAARPNPGGMPKPPSYSSVPNYDPIPPVGMQLNSSGIDDRFLDGWGNPAPVNTLKSGRRVPRKPISRGFGSMPHGVKESYGMGMPQTPSSQIDRRRML